jgi:hypothetical protein
MVQPGRKRREIFMRERSFLGALLLVGALIPLTSCNNSPDLSSIQITPGTVTATAGATWQFTAIGYYNKKNKPPETKDITSQVKWASASAQMVTVSSTGFATVTGISYGNTTVTASMNGFYGIIVGSANVSVPAPTTTAAVGVSKLAIQKTTAPDGATQFTAIGKGANGEDIELASQPKWTSSDSAVASIDAASGQATRLASGRTTIIAVYTNPDGTNAIGTTSWSAAPVN